MRNRLFKLLLLVVAAAGGVAFWQKKNETPPLAPVDRTPSRPSEPFMDPATEPTPVAADADAKTSAGADDAAEESVQPDESAQQDELDEPADEPRQSIRPAELGTDALPATVDDPGPDPLPDPPRRPFGTAPEGPADDLQKISGIGPKLEETLNEEGITTYAQLAALDDVEVDALQTRLGGVAGRIRREEWVEQAAELAN